MQFRTIKHDGKEYRLGSEDGDTLHSIAVRSRSGRNGFKPFSETGPTAIKLQRDFIGFGLLIKEA